MMGRWLGVLLAETGSTTDPATLHYDYIDVETTANVIQLAKQSFWWGSFPLVFVFWIEMLGSFPLGKGEQSVLVISAMCIL